MLKSVSITISGGGGVTSLNGLTGALNITSTDSSVAVTPSGSSINLSVASTLGAYLKRDGTTIGATSQIQQFTNGVRIGSSAIDITDDGATSFITGTHPLEMVFDGSIRITGENINHGPTLNLGGDLSVGWELIYQSAAPLSSDPSRLLGQDGDGCRGGDTQFFSGSALSGSFDSGDMRIGTGRADGTGGTGKFEVVSGDCASGGTSGPIILATGFGATKGPINIGRDANSQAFNIYSNTSGVSWAWNPVTAQITQGIVAASPGAYIITGTSTTNPFALAISPQYFKIDITQDFSGQGSGVTPSRAFYLNVNDMRVVSTTAGGADYARVADFHYNRTADYSSVETINPTAIAYFNFGDLGTYSATAAGYNFYGLWSEHDIEPNFSSGSAQGITIAPYREHSTLAPAEIGAGAVSPIFNLNWLNSVISLGGVTGTTTVNGFFYNPTVSGTPTTEYAFRANRGNAFIAAAGRWFFRSATTQSIWSSAANILDVDGGTTFNQRVGGTTQIALTSLTQTYTDAVNIVVGSTTGTKIGTATTQKLALFNSTPIVQPANTVAINDVQVNLGLRATGGVSNFSTTIKPRTGGTAAGSEPIQFTSASLLTSATAGTVEFLTDKYYGTITTGTARKEITLNDAALTSGTIPVATTNGRLTDSGLSSPTTADLTAQTTAVASVVAVTTPNDGVNHQYEVGAYTAITAISAGTLTVQVTFTDENNVAQTLNFFPMGITTAGLSATGFTGFPPANIRCKPNTAVTLKTTFTGVSVTYDIGGNIIKIN